MKQMMFNLVIALVMIYIVMAAVFESLLFPAAIMSGVLFSIFGVFWLFWLTGTEFNIMAFIGILVLMGVVVNNGIVMIEHINNLRRRGMSRTDALVEGSRERLRPILMTMGTAILAMVPIALSTSDRQPATCPAYYPMARAIAGGLAFSTIVSLLFLPTIYAMLDDLRHGTVARDRTARAARRGRRAGGDRGGDQRGMSALRSVGSLQLQPSSLPRIRTADPHADRVPRLVSKKLSSTRATRLRYQPRNDLHVVAQRHEVGVGRLAHPCFDERADRAGRQRRMERLERRRDERRRGCSADVRLPAAQPIAPSAAGEQHPLQHQVRADFEAAAPEAPREAAEHDEREDAR